MSLFETITGIPSMIYINPHHYQTPSAPNPRAKERRKTPSDGLPQYKLQASFIPESGSFARMKLSEL